MAKKSNTLWIAIIAGVVILFGFGGFDYLKDGATQAAGGTVDAPTSTITDGGICIYDGATMTIGPVVKKYAPTTALTGFGHRVLVNGFDKGLKTDGATLDINPGDSIELIYNENHSTQTPADYYAAQQTFSAPCSSAFSTGADDVDPDNKHEMILGTLPTISFFNDDDGLKNSQDNNESMAASDSSNSEIKIQKPSEAGFSPYGNQYLCAQYNSSLYDDVEITAVSGVTGTVASVSVPSIVSQHATLGSLTNYKVDCWISGGTSGANTIVEKYNLYLKSSSLTPPVEGGTGDNSAKSAVIVSLWDEDFYRDSDTGLIEFGVETDTNGEVGNYAAANATFLVGS